MPGLVAASKYYPSPQGARVILDEVSLLVSPGMHLGILGESGSGKTTVAQILCGLEPLDEGDVIETGSMSWPIGFAGGFHRELTADDNVRIIARIYSADPEEISAFCIDLSELGDDYYRPLRTYSGSMRARLGFALSMAFAFDTYLADDVVGVGNGPYRNKCERILQERIDGASFILLTKNPRAAQRFCTEFAILRDGRLIHCDNFHAANRMFNVLDI